MSSINAVIGLGFGDEGKGLVTGFLSHLNKNSKVVRYSGGQQAGHQVVNDGKRHIFSNYGSGTLHGLSTFWSKFSTIDPIGIVNEYNVLMEKDITPILIIDYRCPVTTPFDMYSNQTCGVNTEHGTCGLGFGKTIQREEDLFSLTFIDLYYPKIFEIKLSAIKEYYRSLGLPVNIIKLDRFYEAVNVITEQITTIKPKMINDFDLKSNIIFEGSQGLLLDQNIGFFPNVTRSNTGSKNIINLLGHYDVNYYLVSRAYQTRHGNGSMTNTEYKLDINENPFETNETNEFQGMFRKSVLDLDLIEYAIRKDENIYKSKNKNLVITCVDQLNHFSFTHKNKLYEFEDHKSFLNEIAKTLNIFDLFYSKSDESKEIIKFL